MRIALANLEVKQTVHIVKVHNTAQIYRIFVHELVAINVMHIIHVYIDYH